MPKNNEIFFLKKNQVMVISFKKMLLPDVRCLDEILILLSLEILRDNRGIAKSVENNRISMQKKVPKNYISLQSHIFTTIHLQMFPEMCASQ